MPAAEASPTRLEGFAVGYAANKGLFRVYVMAAVAALFVAVFFLLEGGAPALLIAALTASTAYYFYPLTETGKPRFGANQYGFFVDGFGVIAWRAIADVSIRSYAMRSIEIQELQIKLSQPLSRALTPDWRKLPLYRLLMVLPWTMTSDGVVAHQSRTLRRRAGPNLGRHRARPRPLQIVPQPAL